MESEQSWQRVICTKIQAEVRLVVFRLQHSSNEGFRFLLAMAVSHIALSKTMG